MSNLTNLGIKNFRVFNENTLFDLAPLTILTGTNSSGKSSLFKGLILLQDNVQSMFNDLDFFCSDVHKLGNFENAKNKKSNSNEISFELIYDFNLKNPSQYDKVGIEVPNFIFWKKIKLEISFTPKSGNSQNGELKRFNFYSMDNNETELIFGIEFTSHDFPVFYKINEQGEREDNEEAHSERVKSFINIEYFSKKLKQVKEDIESKSKNEKIRFPESIYYSFALNGWGVTEEEFKKYDMSIILPKKTIEKNLKIDLSDENYLYLQELIAYIIKDSFQRSFPFNYGEHSFGYNVEMKDIKDILGAHFSYLLDENEYDNYRVYKPLKTFKPWEENEDSTISNLGLKGILNEDFLNMFIARLVKPNIEQMIDYLLKSFKDTEFYYIEAVRANTQRLYYNNSIKSFDNLLLEYKSKGIQKENLDFINQWLKKLEICERIEIEDVESVASKMWVFSEDGAKMNLADMGYGVTQILPLFLRILFEIDKMQKQNPFYHYFDEQDAKYDEHSLANYRTYKTFLIEEPETNLHPTLQAKLADFFFAVAQRFRVRFIIETHSEYLIRKLQVLTKRGDINTNDSVIYYFKNPQKLGKNEPNVNKITIDGNGNLNGEFGKGFIDEADSLAWELFRTNKHRVQ